METTYYDEENGPDQQLADTISEPCSPTAQEALYEVLTKLYNLTDSWWSVCDYFKVDTVLGTDYYSPNDEEWGAIVAVSHEHKLALYTGFYEMDDMEDPARGYSMVVRNGILTCID